MKLSFIFILLLFLLLPIQGGAQVFGNEWISYNQSYYTFPITQDGIYRLDYSTLVNASIPVSSFSSDNIQIFGKEREIPIHIEDGVDNSLDPGDYILFYGEGNDGWLDSLMYDSPEHIGNPEYSLYNDTLLYFFTWNNSSTNRRFVVETDVNFISYSNVADYILYATSVHQSLQYHKGERTSFASSSFFTPGEGWGAGRKNGVAAGYTPDIYYPNTPHPYTGPGAPNAFFTGRSVSASNASGNPNHHMRWLMGTGNDTLLDTTWQGYGQVRCNKPFSPALLSNGNTPVTMAIIDDLNVATDFQAFQ